VQIPHSATKGCQPLQGQCNDTKFLLLQHTLILHLLQHITVNKMNSLVKEKQEKSIRLPYADHKMKHHNLSKTS